MPRKTTRSATQRSRSPSPCRMWWRNSSPRKSRTGGIGSLSPHASLIMLNPLKERFRVPIQSVATGDLDAWLRNLGHTARTRRNALVSLTTLFRFARGLGYLPKNVPTEAESVTRPKVRSGEIGIISPGELATIIHAADSEERKIYFALGASPPAFVPQNFPGSNGRTLTLHGATSKSARTTPRPRRAGLCQSAMRSLHGYSPTPGGKAASLPRNGKRSVLCRMGGKENRPLAEKLSPPFIRELSRCAVAGRGTDGVGSREQPCYDLLELSRTCDARGGRKVVCHHAESQSWKRNSDERGGMTRKVLPHASPRKLGRLVESVRRALEDRANNGDADVGYKANCSWVLSTRVRSEVWNG